jgi:hypothetical protein
VLGFYKIDAFNNVVYWYLPSNVNGKIGIKNLRFSSIVTDIVSDGEIVSVLSNAPFKLKINDSEFNISEGVNDIRLK